MLSPTKSRKRAHVLELGGGRVSRRRTLTLPCGLGELSAGPDPVPPDAPVRIEYRLADLGMSLLEPPAALRHWRSTISTMSCWHRRPTMSTTEMQRAPALIKLPPAERSLLVAAGSGYRGRGRFSTT